MIKDIICGDISSTDFSDLVSVFSESFDSSDPWNNIKDYVSKIDRVLIYYEEGCPKAFLFYQIVDIDSVQTLHLSLSGKTSSSRGVQKKLGGYLYFKYVFNLKNIFRRSAFVTISNNPRSYFNMYSIGPNVYPDVLNKSKDFKSSNLYARLPEVLEIKGVNPDGLIPDRCLNLGFSIRSTEVSSTSLDERGVRFMEYIKNDANNGVLVMVCVYPLIDVPRHFTNRILKYLEAPFKKSRRKPELERA